MCFIAVVSTVRLQQLRKPPFPSAGCVLRLPEEDVKSKVKRRMGIIPNSASLLNQCIYKLAFNCFIRYILEVSLHVFNSSLFSVALGIVRNTSITYTLFSYVSNRICKSFV